MADEIPGSALRVERDDAEVGQEAVARAMGVSVKTIQRLEKAASVRKRDASAYRAAIRSLIEDATISPRDVASRVGESSTRYGKARQPIAEVLKSRRALKWLMDFRDELRGRGADEDVENRAIRFVTDESTLGSLLGGQAGAGLGFTEDEALDAMESAAEAVRSRIRGETLKSTRAAMLEDPDIPAERPSEKRQTGPKRA